jgi:Zinc finger, C2H2 type.
MYLCNVCSKTFTRSDNLRRHERESCKPLNVSEPEAKRVKLHHDNQSPVVETINCCGKEIPKSQIYAHRRTLEHRTVSCTPKCDGVQIINSAFKCRIISYRVQSETKHTDYINF